MIVIKKTSNHMNERKLNKEESIIFLELLREELTRHRIEINSALLHLYDSKNQIQFLFWKQQIENHGKDIEKMEKCIEYLKSKWSIT